MGHAGGIFSEANHRAIEEEGVKAEDDDSGGGNDSSGSGGSDSSRTRTVTTPSYDSTDLEKESTGDSSQDQDRSDKDRKKDTSSGGSGGGGSDSSRTRTVTTPSISTLGASSESTGDPADDQKVKEGETYSSAEGETGTGINQSDPVEEFARNTDFSKAGGEIIYQAATVPPDAGNNPVQTSEALAGLAGDVASLPSPGQLQEALSSRDAAISRLQDRLAAYRQQIAGRNPGGPSRGNSDSSDGLFGGLGVAAAVVAVVAVVAGVVLFNDDDSTSTSGG